MNFEGENGISANSEYIENHPYLNICVRRTHILKDALDELEIVAVHLINFHKQIMIEFMDEQTYNASGVTREFFHFIFEKNFIIYSKNFNFT